MFLYVFSGTLPGDCMISAR